MRFILFIRWWFRVRKIYKATRKNFNKDFGITGTTGTRNLRKFSFGMVVAIVTHDYLETLSDPEDKKAKESLKKFANGVYDAYYKPKES